MTNSVRAEDDSVKVSRETLNRLYTKLSVCSFNDSLVTAYKQNLQLVNQLTVQKDSLISIQRFQLDQYKSLSDSFVKDLTKKKPWYNNVYVGFAIGAVTVYLSAKVMESIR